MGMWLVAHAWSELLYVDLVGLKGFRAVQRVVAGVRPSVRRQAGEVTGVVEAVRTASVFYLRHTRCLQRSAVVTRLLRRRGVDASLVIGCQPLPLQAHAWVEVDGLVVSDQLDGLEHFHVLDRW